MKRLIPLLLIPALALADGPRAIAVTSVTRSGEGMIASVSLAFGAGRAGWTFDLVAMSGGTDRGDDITAWARKKVVATIGPNDSSYVWNAPAGFWNYASCLRFALVPKNGMPYDNRCEYVTVSHPNYYWIDTGVRCTSKEHSYRLETDATFTQSGWFGANYYLQLNAGLLANPATKSHVVIDYNSAGDYALHCYQDGNLISGAERNWRNTSTPSSVLLAMWALGQNSSNADTGPTGSIWAWKVWKNGELVSDIVPVVKGGEPRVFDRMTGEILQTQHFQQWPNERGPDVPEPPDSISDLVGSFTGTEVVDGIEWTYYVADGEAMVLSVAEGTSGAIAIPSSIGGYPVTRIGESAFWGCSNLTAIAIPNSVKSIDHAAFRFCSSLTTITIPASVTAIGELAFGGCDGLESIVVAASNPVFDSRNDCNAIVETESGRLVAGCKNTVIPNGVTSIGDFAFNRCYGLTSITIPTGVTNIDRYAFSGCFGLATVMIQEGVESISPSAFAGCSGLVSFSVASDNPAYASTNGCLISKDGKTFFHGINGDVTIPQCVTCIGNGAFYGCSGLTSVTIPDGVTHIGAYAFLDCSGLMSITIPNGVTHIGVSAFLDCSDLTSITIPDTVTSIGDNAFYGCSSLTSITVPYAFSSEVGWWELPEGCQISFGDRLPLTLVTDATLPAAREGFSYLQGLEATGGLRPYSFERVDDAGSLPWMRIYDGMTLYTEDGEQYYYSGELSGCPDTADVGTHSFTLRVTDAEGTTTQKAFTIVVRPGIDWTPKASRFRIDPGAVTNLSGVASDSAQGPFSFQWNISKPRPYDDGGWWWDWNDLECSSNSFVFDSSVSGEGKHRISVYANDGIDFTEHSWIVTVAPKTNLVIETDAALRAAKVGQSYWQELVISGGEEPYVVEIVDQDDWPGWLWFDSFDRWMEWEYLNPVLQGYPSDSDIGEHSFTLRVTDAEGTIVEKSFTLVVRQNASPVIESWTPDARRFRIDPGATTNFSVTAFDSDGDDLWFYWDVAKQTAEGWSWIDEIELDETFSFDSSAYGEGRYRIECQVSDNWYSDWKSWTITVAEKTPLAFVTDAVLPTARAGYYWQEVKISGGEEPYTVEIVDRDTWPDWLYSDVIERWDEWGYDYPFLQGHPDNDDVGTYSFALRVTDAEGMSIEQAFAVAVVSNSAPVIESWSPETARFRIDPGVVTNFSVTATDPDGDDLSFRWRIYKQGDNFGSWMCWEEAGTESESFVFRSSRYGEGLYRIEAEVGDGAYSEQHTWIVSVARDRPLAIMTEQSLPSGKAYWSYSQELRITGGAEPYVVEIVDRNIESDWLYVNRWQDSWGNVCHVLRGTPYSDDVGPHSFTLRVTDAKGTSVEKTFTVVIEPNSQPVIESWTPTTARFRMDYGSTTNFSLLVFDSDGDELSYDWNVYKKTADGWDWVMDGDGEDHFSFDSSRFGEGRYEVDVYVSDGGISQSRSWTFTVGPKTPLAFVTDASLPSAKAGWYYNQELEIAGGEEPYAVEILDHGTWPGWLWSGDVENLDGWTNGDPEFYGHPYDDDVGTHSFTLRVADTEGTSVERTFTLVVLPNASPVLESCSPESSWFRISPGVSTNFIVTASDPDGDKLSFYWNLYRNTEKGRSWLDDRTGTGTFMFDSSVYGAGRYSIEVSVSDGGYSVSRSWMVTVAEKQPLAIVTDAVLPSAKAGWYYNRKLEIVGGEEPYAVEILDHGTWPDWLWSGYVENLDGWTNDDPRFYGHPYGDDVGTNSFTLRVTDAEGTSIERTFTIVVEPNSEPVIESWTPTAARFRIDPGSVTNFSVTASDPDGDKLSFYWSLSRITEYGWSWLHEGNGTGTFMFDSSTYGPGRYSIEVSVSDGGYSVSRSWMVTVAEKQPLAIVTDAVLPAAKAGWSYNRKLEIVGGEEPYAVEILDHDAWPDWLWSEEVEDLDGWTNDDPRFYGHPYGDDVGTNSFTLRVTDAEGTSVEKSFMLVVEPNSRPVIESWTPTAARFRIDPGSVTNFSVTASDPDGDELSFYWRLYRITENGWSWLREGTGNGTFVFHSSAYGPGRYSIEVSVSDGGYSVSRSWMVTVAEKQPLAIVTDAVLPAAKAGWSYNRKLEIVGGEEPYAVEILDHGTWPNWLWSGDVENLDGWTNGDPEFYGHPYGDDVGTNSFTLRVTDAEGTSVEKTFTVVVEPNSAPVIESCSPESSWFRISPGVSTNFIVTASDPDGDKLSFYWNLYRNTENGWSWLRNGTGTGTFVFHSSVYGADQYAVEVSVSDGGYSVSQSWMVFVGEAWTMYTPEPVPYAWLDRYYSDLVSWIDYEDCGFSCAANGVNRVWECYVAGLDPTNATNRFLATIGFDDEGRPEVKWTPVLSDEEAAKRTYTILGKTSITNAGWTVVAPGTEADYNFFSVSVEMK